MTHDDIMGALGALEERFQPLVARAPIGVLFVNPSLEVHSCNARCVALLRTTSVHLRGLDLGALPDQRPVAALRRALAGEVGSYEGPYDVTAAPAAGPRHLTMRFNPLHHPTTPGAIVGAVGFVDDISDRIVATEALARSEERFRAVLERSRDSIAVYRDGRFVYANPAMAAALRYDDPSQLVGMAMLDVIHPDDRATVMVRRAHYESGHPLPPAELRFVRRDGSFGYIEVVSMPIDFDGPAILSIARDLTEVRLMQADLLHRDRMASVGTLAAGVAHEINNPLSYLTANLEGIENRKLAELRSRIASVDDTDGPDARVGTGAIRALLDEVEVMIRLAREGADQVRTIVADLKTFSRSDEAPRSWIDVHRVLDAAVHMAWSGLPRRIAVTKHYSDTPPFFGNESRLAQVFLNILVNATHAVEGQNDPRIDVIATTDPSGRATVTIRDNGRGMPPEVVKRIFDPFFTTKPAGVGTGLGLWVCQGIVSSWGGRIDVESAPERGTSFTVVLPQLVEREAPRPTPLALRRRT